MDEPVHDRAAEGSREPSEEEIATRAYEISRGEDSGTAEENWERARRELSAGR